MEATTDEPTPAMSPIPVNSISRGNAYIDSGNAIASDSVADEYSVYCRYCRYAKHPE